MNYRIRPLNSGYIPTKPLEYWYHFSCSKYIEKYGLTNELDQLPDFTFLIEGGDKLILVDTGMSWDEHADKYHHGPSTQRPGVDDIESRLAQAGYKPEDVDIVIFTHLHWDHVFYIEKFVNARFIVNEVEWNYAHNPVSLHFKSYCRPIICKDLRVFLAGCGILEVRRLNGVVPFLSIKRKMACQVVQSIFYRSGAVKALYPLTFYFNFYLHTIHSYPISSKYCPISADGGKYSVTLSPSSMP